MQPPEFLASETSFSRRRLSMEDFEKMKVLDANAVPHTEESAESSDDDCSSERSYVQAPRVKRVKLR